MVKFYKPGKVVVILNGKHAGRKGIIVKSNYENSKERKYPHCMVVGLSKGPRKATKRSLKKLEDLQKRLAESKSETAPERLQKLKSLGVFIKTYNMSHLLVTRYSIKEDFGIAKSLDKVDTIEAKVKDIRAQIIKLEHEKKEENKAKLDELRKQAGTEEDNYKETLREVRGNIGTEMFSRFMNGFNNGTTAEEKEKEQHSQFLFKKLQF